MDEFVQLCVKNMIEGIAELPKEAQDKALCQCGRACASTGVIDMYKDLYEKSNRNIDLFFENMNFQNCVMGKVRECTKEYEIMFPKCLCDLYTMGITKEGCMCECSKQSILFCLNTIAPEYQWKVTLEKTIIRGGDCCVIKCVKNN